jgi:hypothetical protein
MGSNRTLKILFAFLLALVVTVILVALGTVMSDSDLSMTERIQFFGTAFLETGTGPAIALALSLAAIALAEMTGIGSAFYYVIGGLIIGFVTSWSVDLSPALENTTDIAPITLAKTMATVASGIGGLVYWFIAGRTAGRRAMAITG